MFFEDRLISGSLDKFKQLRFWSLETCKTTDKKKTNFGQIFDFEVVRGAIVTLEKRGISVYEPDGGTVTSCSH